MMPHGLAAAYSLSECGPVPQVRIRPISSPASAVHSGAQHRVVHQLLRRAGGQRFGFDTEIPQHLESALVGDVGARGVGHPAVFADTEPPAGPLPITRTSAS
jgi:hypothetical protein